MIENVDRHESDKRVIRTKKSIKAALFKLMEEKDISSITISELTKEANVNRRTFYTHYRNITDILDEIESDLVRELSRLMGDFNPDEYRISAYNLFMGLNNLISEDFDYYFNLVRVDMRGMLLSRLRSVVKETTDLLMKRICRNSENASLASAFIVGGFFNLYMEWYNNPCSLTAEQAAEVASSIVAHCVNKMSN